jgi:hypothetical protein
LGLEKGLVRVNMILKVIFLREGQLFIVLQDTSKSVYSLWIAFTSKIIVNYTNKRIYEGNLLNFV